MGNGLEGNGGLAGRKCYSDCSLLGLRAFKGYLSSTASLHPYCVAWLPIVPDLPSMTKTSIYTQEQLDISQKHMNSVGRKPPAKFSMEDA